MVENKNTEESNHITTEEILDFLSVKKYTPEYMQEANRINLHINSCEECQKEYSRILKMQNELEEAIRYESKEDRLKERIEWKLFQISEELEEQGKDAKAYFENAGEIVLSAKLKIRDYAELTAQAITGMGTFAHPRFSTALRSTNQSMQGAEKKSVVEDEKSNKFVIERDGTLSVEFSRYEYAPGTLVFLVSENEDAEPYCEELRVSEDNPDLVVAEFSDVTPGEYVIAMK